MELLTGMTRMGFSEYEAKTYLALLQDNPATGYQLSKKSGLSRPMVYKALNRLSIRGVVLETIENRATLYRPLPPDLLLDRYEKEQRQLTEEMREGLGKCFTITEKARVWSMSGKAPAISYAAQMIHEAGKEIFLILPDHALESLHQEIADAGRRGVELNALLTGQADLPFGRVVHHPVNESELQDLTDTLMVVVDSAKVLIADMKHETVATITGNRHLVLIARQFIWMELFAQRISDRLGTEVIEKLEPGDRNFFSSHHIP